MTKRPNSPNKWNGPSGPLARWRAALRAGGRRRALAVLGFAGVLAAVALLSLALVLGVSLQLGVRNLQTAGGTVSLSHEEEVEVDGCRYVRDPNMVAIALIGYDQRPEEVAEGRAGQADALMVLALDLNEGARRVIVIPRDSMVAVDQHLGEAYTGQATEQICLAYSYGDGREASCAYTLDAMERALPDVPLSYYAAINMAGAGPLTDALGGVELTPLATIPDTDIVEGERTVLHGFDAEWYLRWRDLSELDSSAKRQERQEQYVRALAEQLCSRLAAWDVPALAGAYGAVSPYLVSNMGLGEMLAAARAFTRGGAEDGGPEMVTLPGELRAEDGRAAYYLNQDAVQGIVLDTFYTKLG